MHSRLEALRKNIPAEFAAAHRNNHQKGTPMTPMEDTAIAREIIGQLGGFPFFAVTGAKNPVALKNGLMFSLPGNITKSHGNRFKITLNGSDLYDLEYGKLRSVNHIPTYKTLETATDIFCEQLGEIFTAWTGLDSTFNSRVSPVE